MPNKIVEENAKSGSPQSEWDLAGGVGSSNIEGYATEMSVNLGQQVSFKINTDSSHYRIDIYRLGYYGGDGARKVDSIEHSASNAVRQPTAITDPATGLVDAGNWSVTDTWTVPSDLVSGVYIAKLVREDGTFGENHIPFIVRDDGSRSDIVFKTSDETWQAYNPWGGNNFYDGGDYAVSYNRPFSTREGALSSGPWNYIFGAEHSAIRWLEANGYDVSYIAGLDTARMGDALLNHRLFLSVGHDEYWSAEQRANVEAARDAGVNLAFWSGNEVFWKTRWENSIDGSETAYRTLVSYKESIASRPDDPSDTWTGTWRDSAFSGGQPENSLTGTLYMVDSTPLHQIEIPYDMSRFRFWQNTTVADLQPGETARLTGYLGYEWDDDVDNGHRPAGLVALSRTQIDVDKYVQEDVGKLAPGTSTHSLTLYRAESGALVFGAGTVFWSWGLDAHHDRGPFGESDVPADPRVQQAMVNLLAEMGIQPATLQAGLVQAAQSTDHIAPTSSVLAANSLTVVTGQTATISGTALDQGGGVVAAIEVSTDDGATWHRASGFENWTYSWNVPFETGTFAIKTRAVDDSINIEQPGTGFAYKAVGFDATAYLSAYPDVKAAGVDPYQHYLQDGWKEGRDPSASFDTGLYLAHNQDVRDQGLNPLVHYIEHGMAEGRPTYAAIGNAIAEDGFDPEYYLMVNRDVAQAGVDPYQHYLQDGWKEGRNPNAYFDTKGYLTVYTDVADAGINPLEHYSRYGWQEHRDPSPEFDTAGYLTANTDVADAQIDPLTHFLQYGAQELRTTTNDGLFS